MKRVLPCALALLASLALLRADGPADNIPEKVRAVPPAGVKVPEQDATALKAGLDDLGKDLAALPAKLKGKAALLELIPDVEIYHKAVRYALTYNEFYSVGEVAKAMDLLRQGKDRATLLAAGKPSWTTATGLVVRGYRSKIDGGVQPYGLVVPTSFKPDSPHRHRLDFWLHGRGEKLSEVSFILGRQSSRGEFTPPHAFVLHPYGRYCNAFKFAGEVDVLEALEHARKHYPIDDDRLVMRGFSMGGAGCWTLSAHYPGLFCASAPGAGFSETPEFLKIFQKENVQPKPWEKTLWTWHDVPGWAGNFANLPLVMYSGEKDSQKQAADVMVPALRKNYNEPVHIIGPNTGHSYHPASKAEINRRIDAIAARGKDRQPTTVNFTTYTTRYDASHWVRIDRMAEHWKPATIQAFSNGPEVSVTASGVTAFTVSFPPGEGGIPGVRGRTVRIRKVTGGRVTYDAMPAVPVRSDRSWSASCHLDGGEWKAGSPPAGLAKKHGLSGPIDDAFMDSFVMVRPTGKAANDAVGKWAASEMDRAVKEWRSQFRGDARVKDDKAVTDADIRDHNLVLWGDASSNAVLAKIADKLPIRWDDKAVKVGDANFDAKDHALVVIYPNPLNPERYVVINSGFTFREYDYLNNARQVPRLPDWAVIDVRTPANAVYPGKVAKAGFFDEAWKLK